MSSNPFVSAANHIKDTLSDAMHRLSTTGHSQAQHQSASTSHEQANPRHMSMDTSNIAKVLVIGETGSGKSTFINYLTNYFLGGTLQNVKVAIPSKFRPHITEQFSHCENNLRDTTQSKTDRCNQYIFVDPNSPAQRQYLFLDTPGLSDTRGAEQDNVNMMKIIDGVEGLGGLSAVIIVVNGTTGRLTLNLRNVIARLRGNLPDIVMDNVIVVMTNAKRHEANFNISSLQLHGTVYPYYMQNSAFSQDPSTWDQAALDALQFDWDASMDEMRRMIETIDTFKTKSVTAFKDMKDIRNAIKALMHEARLEVSQIQKMQDELAAFEHALKQYKNDEVNYKDYTRERVVETKELVDAKYHSTVCRKCDFVCHDKCGLNETTTHGNRIFQRCWAMSPEGQCFVCPSHCLYTEHYHARKTMKVKQQKLQDVLHDIKAKYDLATKNKTDFQSRITTTQDAKKMLENALKQKLDEIKQKCVELRRICSGFNLAQELHALIDQLKAEATMLRNIEAKQQAEEFIRSLSEFCRQLEADQNSKLVLPPMRLVDTYTSKPLRSGMSAGSTSASSVSTPPPPVPSENTPNLNTNVLDLIAKLNKTKKAQPSSSGEEDDGDESNSEEHNGDESPRAGRASRSNNDHDEEVSSINARRRRRQSNAGTATNNPQQQYDTITTADLVQRCSDCKDPRKTHPILAELNRRAQGKSTGPLTSPTDIGAFARYSQMYGSQDTPTLSHVYLQLQQKISTITEPDILNISRVPHAMLLETAAIYTLISERNKQTQSQNDAMANEGPFDRPPDHIAAAMMQKMGASVSQTPMSFYGIPVGHHPGGATTTPAATPMPTNAQFKPIDTTNLPSSSMSATPSMFSSALPPPVPSSSFASSSMTGTTTTTLPNQPLSPPPLASPSASSQLPPLSFSSFAGFQSPTTASSISSPQFGFSASTTSQPPAYPTNPFTNTSAAPADRSMTRSPFTFITPSASNAVDASFQFVSSTPVSTGRDDYTMINITPMPNIAAHDDDPNNSNPLASASQARLLSSYNEAKFSNKNAQLFAIYQELERRCAGINCQQLAKDYSAVYQTKLDEYAPKSVFELKQLYHNVQQQVQARTQNDATHINDVPKELLIESAALLASIKSKEP